MSAVHLGGVADLPTGLAIDLRVSADGLDIVGDYDAIIGRLGWDDLDELAVPDQRGRLLRRDSGTRLVVRTDQGDATFDVTSLDRDELRASLAPLVARFLR
jgi:hypothetical protein